MEGQEAGRVGRGHITPLKGFFDQKITFHYLKGVWNRGQSSKTVRLLKKNTYFSRIMNYQPHLLDEIIKRNHRFIEPI